MAPTPGQPECQRRQAVLTTAWSSRTIDFEWNDDSALSQVAYPNGVATTYTLDDLDRTAAIVSAVGSSTPLSTLSYSYDDAGQLVGDAINGQNRSYTFDAVGQLASRTDSGGTLTYNATSAGQLNGLGGTTLNYDTTQALTSAMYSSSATAMFQHDLNGSRISAAVNGTLATEYSYDVMGNLTSVDSPSGPDVSYISDGDGLRRVRSVGSTTSDSFLWDVSGSLPLLLDDGSQRYLYGPTSTPVAQVDTVTGDIEYLHGDLIGSVRLITDDAGASIGTSDYDPFGRTDARTGATSAFGYSGNWTDPDTGFVYLRARDYDPLTGQFLQVDPAVDQTRQPYAYADNNPLQFTDPTGLCIGMDGTPQDRHCEYWDYFWANLGGSWDEQFGHFHAGAEDGATFNIKRLFDDTNHCQHGQEVSYWAGNVAGVLGSVGFLLSMGSGSPSGIGKPTAGNPELPGLPATAPKPLGNGSTGRTTPANLTEQLAMTEVRSAPGGRVLDSIKMNDSRWPGQDGWVKMQQTVNGVTIHYVRNTRSGAVDDFKFVKAG